MRLQLQLPVSLQASMPRPEMRVAPSRSSTMAEILGHPLPRGVPRGAGSNSRELPQESYVSAPQLLPELQQVSNVDCTHSASHAHAVDVQCPCCGHELLVRRSVWLLYWLTRASYAPTLEYGAAKFSKFPLLHETPARGASSIKAEFEGIASCTCEPPAGCLPSSSCSSLPTAAPGGRPSTRQLLPTCGHLAPLRPQQ